MILKQSIFLFRTTFTLQIYISYDSSDSYRCKLKKSQYRYENKYNYVPPHKIVKIYIYIYIFDKLQLHRGAKELCELRIPFDALDGSNYIKRAFILQSSI